MCHIRSPLKRFFFHLITIIAQSKDEHHNFSTRISFLLGDIFLGKNRQIYVLRHSAVKPAPVPWRSIFVRRGPVSGCLMYYRNAKIKAGQLHYGAAINSRRNCTMSYIIMLEIKRYVNINSHLVYSSVVL